jgi:protein O-GlcNAc transferase
MKKVITFSLWGNQPMYTIGAIKNAQLAQIFYPDFECWIYIHEDTVPIKIFRELSILPNVKIIFKTGDLTTCKPMMWRFEAIDEPEVEIMMSRDTDTRFLLREKLAVDGWLNSNKIFHIMRDHPHHAFKILGGMFGTKKIPQINSWTKIINNISQEGDKMYDQHFLADQIYPHIINNSLIHSNFHIYENESVQKMPINYDKSFRFVGEYVYEDESRSQDHINALKQSILY